MAEAKTEATEEAAKKATTKKAAKKKTAKKKASKKRASSTALDKKRKGATKEASSGSKIYSPRATYVVGDSIFHPKWSDEGPVVRVEQTADGHDKAVVDFSEVGLKHLVMNHDLDI
jgi:hypothetical protein